MSDITTAITLADILCIEADDRAERLDQWHPLHVTERAFSGELDRLLANAQCGGSTYA